MRILIAFVPLTLFSCLLYCQEMSQVVAPSYKEANDTSYVRYNGLKYSCSTAGKTDSISRFPELNYSAKKPPEGFWPAYDSLVSQYERFRERAIVWKGKEDKIVSLKKDSSNEPLCKKLQFLGLILPGDSSRQAIESGVANLASLFGAIRETSLNASALRLLNVRADQRIQELEKAINIYKWLYCAIQADQKTIVVNIPSANLLVFEGGKVIFDSRVIVGKPSTPTSTITAQLTDVTMFPYWMVPYGIATKELLPKIKKNINFLNDGNFQVLTKKGKIVDPGDINWNDLNRTNFPYILRQSTGCDNSLGIIKLNFYNPFSAYLHDTPEKNLFNRAGRFFSHGCIRVEKALELGKLVLGDNHMAIERLENKIFLPDQRPVIIPVRSKVNIFIVYSVVWMDKAGIPRFYENIYRR